ncbi:MULTISPECIES: hypothetical protein [unclassified Rhodococcus (in: high G+C Gram-positive bacteria)]|uniref:hypothetical protein n=1 Tax=unclassified Rhodococcus (in: high G+C Gram-positive bacteria) TaxID=192944 RepID=UPI0006FCD40B|nr:MULTISPECIES: hypothetical protein [unclassified Rhodococcus (in: high G+C Gram-positive bacteria)]KQU30339.1 hypothetical protein ASG69_04595 [Rhodococcus sp. Leaf225]KQU44756.1 hypothetical protein ASH03_12545 [Rhodococcus sp. Leaf258]
MSESIVDLDEFGKYWKSRTLTAQESIRASVVLGVASDLLRRRVPAVDSDPSLEGTAKYAVMQMTERALGAGKHSGMSSYSVTMDDVVESATLTNPDCEIVLTASLLALFGVSASAGPSWRFGDC